jgi:DNA polymerase-4
MILHVDMDAFYASVEERDHPELQGQPVIVGGTAEKRGVVAAANYVVRSFGVHSAMPTSTALKLCPHAVLMPVRMSHYAEVSRSLHEIFFRYTPLVEPLALDEAFLDVSGSERLFGSPEDMAREIKQAIHDELGLVASVGVATNKFLAKLASDLEKPDGLVVIARENIQQVLDPLPVGRIWGVGKATGKTFERLGIRTIGELRERSRGDVENRFGKMGVQIWSLAHGIDTRAVIPDREAKSISNETTFAADIDDMEILESWLMELTEQVARRLRRSGMRARTVQIKVRYDDFETFTRSNSFSESTTSTQEIWRCAVTMLQERLPARPLCIRLLGLGVSNLQEQGSIQGELFDDPGQESRLDEVTDEIQDRFGRDAVNRAASTIRTTKRKSESGSDDAGHRDG